MATMDVEAPAPAIDEDLYSRQVRRTCGSPPRPRAAPRARTTYPQHITKTSSLTFRLCLSLSLSRPQLFVMGHQAQARMQQSNVLVVGLRGAGVELGA
jgi:hypothetical protein